MSKKLFDFAIGNPPYQEPGKNSRPSPVYHLLMEEAFHVADCVEMITPARYLFEAGMTPKAWNKERLNDEHFKVLQYEQDAAKVFPTTEIKGGVAITVRNDNKTYGKIQIFTAYEQLNGILQKVLADNTAVMFDSLVSSQGIYRFTDTLVKEHPEVIDLGGEGTGVKIVSKVVESATKVFRDKPKADADYCKFLTKTKKGRETKYIRREYLQDSPYLDTYNVMLPESNGNGAFEALVAPEIAEPGTGSSDTFISIGTFGSKDEAENARKYIKTKFTRAMLGVKKVTQHNPKSTWTYVPMQDFTNSSDIDWTAAIAVIDRQLYKKYNLTLDEIDFIEEHVEEMN